MAKRACIQCGELFDGGGFYCCDSCRKEAQQTSEPSTNGHQKSEDSDDEEDGPKGMWNRMFRWL